MEQQQEPKEASIGGVPVGKIRKAYFTGKLDVVMGSIQAKGEVTPEVLTELDLFLTNLKASEESMVEKLKRFFPQPEDAREKLFLAEALGETLSDDDMLKIADEKASCTSAIDTAIKLMKDRANQIFLKTTTITPEEYMDDAELFSRLMYYICGAELLGKIHFKKKVAELIVKGHQRKQAEDLAMITLEYYRWQEIVIVKERVDDIIMLAKKRFSGQFN
jgi:hypothetical protein